MADVPSWLAAAFPGWSWRSLRTCALRVCAKDGAGLDLEASTLGYLVEAVDERPGQDPVLSPGTAILSLAGAPLLGLDADGLEASFGAHFHDGAAVLVVAAEELRRATAVVEEKAATEQFEVEGLVVRSLPQRKRRRPAERATEERQTGGTCDLATAEPSSTAPRESEERRQYEYMDHTADVILHSWGRSLKEAFEQVCVCFFSYMTELDSVELGTSVEVEASGHDLLDLLYHLLDEFLFSFGTEFVICRRIEVLELDVQERKVRARGFGEKFDLAKHPQGTEIKAITMHQMKILTTETLTTEHGTIKRESAQEGTSDSKIHEGFPYECFVLVDI